ncbi:MAG: site-2 protease family protein [bacterium]
MNVQYLILALPVLFFAVVMHEYAHGWMAEKAGDPTARQMGRLTLNPLAHVDPVGTVILPILLIVIKSPILFGWAKPVPINPLNFHNPKRDIIRVSLAGAAANLMLAVVCSILLRISFLIAELPALKIILEIGVLINLILGVFNLIPIPPLDGSKVLAALLPYELAQKFNKLEPYGFLILLGLLWFGVIHFILSIVISPLYALLMH